MAEAVSRGYYESIAVPRAGYRNGYRRGRLRTAEGAIEYGVPHKSESITAELQGATTKYGVNTEGNAGGLVGPRYENPDGTSWRWPRNLCPLCERPCRRYDPHGFRDAPRNSIRGPIDFRGKAPRNSPVLPPYLHPYSLVVPGITPVR